MLELEKKYSKKYKIIAGIDEAGRGPLAGPVVCACVVLPYQYKNEEINDSKILNEATRDRLYELIIKDAITYSVSVKDNFLIDEINILNATKQGMTESLNSLSLVPDFVLTDAVKLQTDLPIEAVIKGDALSLNIAAASIIAKVTRDRIMREYDKVYPQYLFKNNKGYGTREHIEILRSLGATKIHRKSFIKNIMLEQCKMF